MAITLKEVAQQAQISVPAASLILNGKGEIYSKDTNERVHQAARTLGYRPNLAARAARSGKFQAIDLLLSNKSSASRLSVQLMQSILSSLATKNMHMTVSQISDEKLTDQQYLPKVLQQHMVDGMLINYTHHFPEQLSELIYESKLPAIWMNTPLKYDCIYPDEIHAGTIATQHLLDHGHRDIAYIEFDRSEHYSRTDRYAGYEQAITSLGLKPKRATFKTCYPDELLIDPMSCDISKQMIQWFSAQKKCPTAIVTYSAWEAQAIIFSAVVFGLKVPDDLSVITIGDNVSSSMGISLTNAVLPLSKMGQLAVDLLMRKIKAPTKRIRAKILKASVVQAQTTRVLT